MSKLQLKQFFDDQADVMAWVVLIIAVAGRLTENLSDWPFVAMIGLCLVTMLGAHHYDGVKAGPAGFSVDRKDGDE